MALHRAFTLGKATRTPPMPVQFNGAPHAVTILVRPTPQQGGVLLLFDGDKNRARVRPTETTSPADGGRTDALQDELHQTQQRLQAMGEEYETTVEELRAANEELQSTNEEYRSTLEELETSKEELQSINEELQSVNQELRGRVDEVTKPTATCKISLPPPRSPPSSRP